MGQFLNKVSAYYTQYYDNITILIHLNYFLGIQEYISTRKICNSPTHCIKQEKWIKNKMNKNAFFKISFVLKKQITT